MNAPNLALWEQVEKTPTAHVKSITGKAYRGNSPKPHYLVWKATETFGPCGIGWGFEVIDERIVDGHMIEPGFFHRVHIARIRVWYEWRGERGVVEHIGQTEFAGRRASGASFTDEDAPKKSVTDALVKALSMIGFAGDIFIGRYDDSKYVAGLVSEEREAASQPAPPRRDAPSSHGPVAETLIKALKSARTVEELEAWSGANAEAISALPDDYKTDVRRAFKAQRDALMHGAK